MDFKLWCYLEGDDRTFSVKVSPDCDIDELKEEIYHKKDTSLVGYNASNLDVQKVDEDLCDVKAKIRNGQYYPNAGGQGLEEFDIISNIWPEKPPQGRLHVFAHVPTKMGSQALPASNSDRFLDSDLVRDYDDVFVIVNRWRAFESSDIEWNDLHIWYDTTPVPAYVADSEQELERKPGLAPDGYYVYKAISDAQFLDEYFGPRKKGTTEDGSQEEFTFDRESRDEPRRDAGEAEVAHLYHIAFHNWDQFWRGPHGQKLKEPLMSGIFFQPFQCSVSYASRMITAQSGPRSWPFRLIVKDPTSDVKEQLRTYRPSSDFMLFKSNLPRLLVEVNSHPRTDWPGDLVRMLLTGAAVVRFANKFLKRFAGKFVLFAIYIWDNCDVTRYSLFQEPNDKRVHYKMTSYRLDTSDGRAKFALQLYNLWDMLEREGKIDDKNAFERLDHTIKNHDEKFHLKTFTTNTGGGNKSRGSKRKRPEGDVDDPGAGAGAGGVRATDCEELRAHEYEVEPEAVAIVDESGEHVMEPLSRMPPHIFRVYQPSAPSKAFIAKKVREQSDEVGILTYLNNLQPKSEHIISLHTSFQTQSTSWVIFPRMDSVEDYVCFAPKELYGRAAGVCWGLIKGVAYLHKLRIAHRDIKPANLLLDRRDFCLKIIDFDIAMHVKDEDEEVDDQCGSEHWMAPEVEIESVYSPIKADRWSTGKVIFYLFRELKEEDRYLRSIAGKLTAHSPNRRLSMLEIAPPVSNVANVAGYAKVLRSPQVIPEGDKENAKPPKKQRRKVLVD